MRLLSCSKCKDLKPEDDFRLRSDIARGRQYVCKLCTTPEKRTKDQHWERGIKRKFGLSAKDYYDMLDAQGGCCTICGDEECQSGKRFAVDHCHNTGVIRGLLCYNCNTGLGKFRDNVEAIRRAADYVELFHDKEVGAMGLHRNSDGSVRTVVEG